MIRKALNALTTTITDLGLFERYAPLVQTASRFREIARNPLTGEPVLKEQRYPISYGVDEMDCWNNGTYQHLVPDSSKKSVAYFEQVSALQPADRSNPRNTGPKNGMIAMTCQVYFVAWLNLQRCGFADVSKAAEFGLKVIEALDARTFPITDPLFSGGVIEMRFGAWNPKSAEAIFSRYTYDRLEALMFYPHDFFSQSWTVTVRVPKACIGVFELGDPIECITY